MTFSNGPGWRETTLGECANWYSGGTPSTSVAEYWDGDIPWITASSLHDFYLYDSGRRITPAGLENGTRLMSTNSILFVVRGMSLKTEFRVGIARRPMAFGQDCKAIVAKDFVDPLYLANVMRAKAGEILGLVDEASHGTGRLQTSALQQVVVPLPPLAEQRAIAHILGTLDDKIELNRQMNQTLEAMARAIFKSWFVDFDPVHAKARGEPPSGMDAATAALFPDRFEDSDLGPIPAGWRVGSLGDLVNLVKESVKATPDKDRERYVALDDMPSKSVDLSRYRAGTEVNSSIIRFQKDDILFGAMRPYFHKVGLAQFDGITRTTTLVLRPLAEHLRLFGLFHLSSADVVSFATSVSVGTTIPYVKWDALEQYSVPVPPEDLTHRFEILVAPLLELIAENGEQGKVLAELRDTLLPKLMSGELRVPEAAEMVEAA